jgi:hypothetical protein
VASKEPLPIETLVKELTGENNPLFTLSLGNPCAYQKLTVQVMRPDGSILGYLKMPMTVKANQRLRHEATIVQKLAQFPALARRIPRIFFAGLWNGRYIVFQSELKGKTGPAEYSQLHGEFLRILQACEQSTRPGPSLVLEVGEKWDMAASHLSSQGQSLGKRALSIASRELDATIVTCSIHHGDFTPWNSRLSEGSLGLFDWESAASNQPILWDQFHFLAQTESLLSKKYPEAIDVRKSNRSLYLLYLLHSTASFAAENANPAVIEYRQKQMLENMESLS